MHSSTAMSPGALLRAELDARGWTVPEFAEKIGLEVTHTEAILDDLAPYGADTSRRIGEALGSSPGLWLKLQARYQNWQDFVHDAS